MRFRRQRTIHFTVAFATLLLAGPVVAQDGIGFKFNFGWQSVGGDFAPVLDGAVDAEFFILVPAGPLRFGGGANWVSFAMDDFEESFHQVKFAFLVGYPFQLSETLRPYVESHVTYRRLRPEDDRYYGGEEVPLRDFVASGTSLDFAAGMEFILNASTAIDVGGRVGKFTVTPDLTDEGFPGVATGANWRFSAGLTWFPTNGR
jgi:hypothetical protein